LDKVLDTLATLFGLLILGIVVLVLMANGATISDILIGIGCIFVFIMGIVFVAVPLPEYTYIINGKTIKAKEYSPLMHIVLWIGRTIGRIRRAIKLRGTPNQPR
jgi:membrane-bound ClpP family serine protease